MTSLIKYILFLTFLAGAMTLINHFLEDNDKTAEHLSINATSALMLEYAHEDINKAYYKTSIAHIERTIHYMESIKEELDTETIFVIDRSIEQLQNVERGIETGFLNEARINRAFAEALNTLALAHLKITESAMRNENSKRAEEALDIAVVQLKSALKFATGETYRSEEELYQALALMSEENNMTLAHIVRIEDSLKSLIAEIQQ